METVFYIYASEHGTTYLPDRHTDPVLEDFYDDATGEYVHILIYNRPLTKEEISDRKLVFLRTSTFSDSQS